MNLLAFHAIKWVTHLANSSPTVEGAVLQFHPLFHTSLLKWSILLKNSSFQTVNDNLENNNTSAKKKGGWIISGSLLEIILLLSLTSYNTFYSLFKVSQLHLGHKVPGSNKGSFIANIGNVSSCNHHKMVTRHLFVHILPSGYCTACQVLLIPCCV